MIWMNDYDRIADEIGKILALLAGNSHAPTMRPTVESDSISITKDGFICTVIGLQRLRDWAEGLAETHRVMDSSEDE